MVDQPLEGYIRDAGAIPESSYVNPSLSTRTERKIVYNYGEDVIRWGIILPFTLNHVSRNSLQSMFDGQGDTYYELETTQSADTTTTLIIDFGRILEVRGVVISFALTGAGAGTPKLTTSYSEDSTNYTQIGSDLVNSPNGVIYYFDHILPISSIKTLKLVYNTINGLGAEKNVRIYQVSVIV